VTLTLTVRADEPAGPARLLAAALLVLVLWGAGASVPAAVASDEGPSGSHCVEAEEAAARAADDEDEDEDAAPRFTPAFYAQMFTIDASLDGLERRRLPVAIEEVCDVPAPFAQQAAKLAGADGVALVSKATAVWRDRKLLHGTAATRALSGADTAVLRVRLAPLRRWSRDEDGEKVPTFRSRRIVVTD
jgi:hypothetical protein